MKTKTAATLRLDPETLNRLQHLARLESLAQGRTVTWCDVARRLIDQFLTSPQQKDS